MNSRFIPARGLTFLVDIVLALFFIAFIYSHLTAFFMGAGLSMLLFALSETFIVLFFLTRSKAKSVTNEPLDFALAIGATFAGLLFRPDTTPLLISDTLILLGVVMQTIALLSLNTSFGIVPANRGVKQGGLYGIVRHPMYAGYFFLYVGYVIGSFSYINFIVFICAQTLQVMRLLAEERHLLTSPEYQEYKKQVRWRLVPFVF